MSKYASIDGVIRFDNREAFRETVQILQDIKMEDNISLSPGESVEQSEDNPWVINFERGNYRNILRHIDRLVVGGSSGGLVAATTDGQFTGHVETTYGYSVDYELDEWAEEYAPALSQAEPQKEDYDSESDWFDDYATWQADVVEAFMTEQVEEFGLTDEHTDSGFYGDEIEISVPKRAIGLVLERAEFDLYELDQLGDVQQTTVQDIKGAIKTVENAVESASAPN